MARLVDSTVLVTAERRGLEPNAVLRFDAGHPMAISTVSISELLYGAYRADTQQRRDHRLTFINEVVASFVIVPFDVRAARLYGQIWPELASLGQQIGVRDFMIAATALAHGYDILTDNLREFQRVPGLTVIRADW